jgi:hypothetical protein
MPKHRYFEELCALATLGDLPPSEGQELETHLAECSECRHLSADFLRVHRAVVEPVVQETEAIVESSRERVRAAMWTNIALVDKGSLNTRVDEPSAFSLSSPSKRGFRSPLWAGAMSVAVAASVMVSFFLGIRYDSGTRAKPHGVSAAKPPAVIPSAPATSSVTTDQSKPNLQDQNVKLAQALKEEQEQSKDLQQRLSSDDRALSQAIAAQESLRETIDQQTSAVKATQAELDTKKAALEQAQSANSSDGATIAGLQIQVRDLNSRLGTESANLDQERDLLSHGREIRDIIGARNLHIIDVYDTDTKGATRKPFARAFYTEGKSLVYYAYDLPQQRADEGKFSYVAWGENNGKKPSIRKIGILFHDDQTQRRWSLNFSDPQTLREINSVFITLERTDDDLTQPKGKRMLTAYLGTAPNHP